MPLDISNIVSVSATISPTGVLRKEFGRTLLLTSDTTLDAVGAGKVRTYGSFDEVADDFAPGTEPYQAAQIYFAQSPYPKNLLVGRFNTADTDTVITGGAPTGLSNLQAITDGAFNLGGVDFTGFLLTGATSYADVATALQTLLRSSVDNRFANAVVTYSQSPSRFVVNFPSRADFGGVFEAHSTGSGTQVSVALGLDVSSGANQSVGATSEQVGGALDAIKDVDASFYFVAMGASLTPPTSNAYLAAASAWCGAQPVMFAGETHEVGVLTPQEASSVAAQVSALGSPRTFLTWSKTPDYKALSVAARFSSVNFASPGSLITAKFKSLPGTLPDDLTSTEQQELNRKNINHYSPFAGDDIYAEGETLQDGGWIDTKFWIDWFVNAIQVDVYNLLRSTPKIPQTTPGIATITEVVRKVCRQGVANGGIAGGTVSPGLAADIRQSTGDQEFDGVLSNGYLVFAGSLADQSQADRNARKSPPFKIWLKGAGAVHFVDIIVNFEG